MNNIFFAAKVIMVYIFFFILIPVLFLRLYKKQKLLEKCFIGLAISNFTVIILVHLLAILNIYESLSMVICCSIVLLTVSIILNKYCESKSDFKITTAFFQTIDSGEVFIKVILSLILKKIRAVLSYFLNFIKAGFRCGFEFIMLSAGFFGLTFIRFKNSIMHTYLSMPDMYVHLAWSKYLGQNRIYDDSLYPKGYECIISGMNKLFFIDPYIILRFMGPVAGMLLIFSIYYSIKKNYSDFNLPLWISIVIFIMPGLLPADALRMSSALPYEYSVIFILPGIEFFKDYFESRSISKLLLACSCLADVLLIHPRASIYIIMGFIIISAVYAYRFIDSSFLFRTTLAVAISIIVGIAPLLTGYILKTKSMSFIEPIIKDSLSYDKTVKGFNFTEVFKMDWIHALFIILLISYVVNIIIQAVNKDSKITVVKSDIVNLLFYMGTFIIYKAEYFGLPVIIDSNRAGLFFSISISIALIQPLRILGVFMGNPLFKRAAANLICISVIIVIFAQCNISIPDSIQLEYEGAARSYLSIRENFPSMRWTIVSPVEQYQEALGYGWHYNIWEFAYELDNASSKNLSIPTEFVFYFVEKRPLGCDYEVSNKYTHMELPSIKGFKDLYYRNPYYRSIIESKVYSWAEDYLNKNDNMSIYYEDEKMKIYLLSQNSRNPDNLKR